MLTTLVATRAALITPHAQTAPPIVASGATT